jgi:GH24 family phage-related lysozyme (muramidase)
MPIPSRVLASGNSGLATTSICGDGATGLTATGTTAADALQLSAVWNTVATTAASTGVKLPPTEAGAVVCVYNAGASTLTVYPANGSTINAGASSLSVTATTRVLFIATSATTWISIAGA